ncbi:MAG: tetratricopeptide repeat protein [Anaerolineales bacterium]
MPGVFGLGVVLFLMAAVAWVFGGFASPFTQTPPSGDLLPTAQAYIKSGELNGAVILWEEVLTQDPENATAHYQLGLISAITNPDKAITHLDQAAQLDETLNDPVGALKNTLRRAAFAEEPAYRLIQVGQSLANLDEWDLAEKVFQQATQDNPDYPEAWAYLGEAQYHTGEDGLAALEKALNLNPNAFAANTFMGLYWYRQGQPDLALVYLQTAAEIEPDNPALQEDIAAALADLGNFTAALSHLVRLTELLPMESHSWQVLARFSMDYDVQVEEVGLPAARQAVLIAPDDPLSQTLLGQAYMLTGNEHYPIRFFTRALELDRDFPDAHLFLGIYYLQYDDPENAQMHLELAKELGGDGPIGELAQDILDRYFP